MKITDQSTKSGVGEYFLQLDCRAATYGEGVFSSADAGTFPNETGQFPRQARPRVAHSRREGPLNETIANKQAVKHERCYYCCQCHSQHVRVQITRGERDEAPKSAAQSQSSPANGPPARRGRPHHYSKRFVCYIVQYSITYYTIILYNMTYYASNGSPAHCARAPAGPGRPQRAAG